MFVHSLPLFFSYLHLTSPAELLIIFGVVFFSLLLTFPEHEINGIDKIQERYLFSAWTGRLLLGPVFWPFFLILNACLYTADFLAQTGRFTVSGWDELHFILLFPIFWWTISVWRCSKNCQSSIWGAFARLLTLSVFFEYALKFVIRIYYPRIFFACEELLLDYGNCF